MSREIKNQQAGSAHHTQMPNYSGPAVNMDMQQSEGVFSAEGMKKLFRAVTRKWYAILLCAVLAGSFAFYKVQSRVLLYESISKFEVFLRQPKVISSEEQYGHIKTSEEAMTTFLEKLKGKDLKIRAAQIVREDKDYMRISDEELFDSFSVSFNVIRNSRIVQVRSIHKTPSIAEMFSKSFAEAINRQTFENNRDSSENAVSWLKAKSINMRQDLDRIDSNFLQLREDLNIDTEESQKEVLTSELSSVNNNILELESRLNIQRKVIDFIERKEVSIETLSSLPAEIQESESIQNNLSSLQDAERELSTLLIRYTPKHPTVMAQNKVILAIKNNLMRAIKETGFTAKADEKFILSQIEVLKNKQSTLQDNLSGMNLKLVEGKMKLAKLDREREATDISYQGLLKRIEEARLAADANAATVQILDDNFIKARPLATPRSRVFQNYILFGCIIGMLIALILEKLDDFIWSGEEIQRDLGMRVLASIPRVKIKERNTLARICLQNKNSLLSETFSNLRNIVEKAGGKNGYKSILITSCTPTEGKTITASNFALSNAASGKKTLLIDFDLRIPRIYRIFNIEPNNDYNLLKHLDENKKDFGFLPQNTENENLDVICSFPEKDASVTEILSSPSILDLISWARENYDCIVIDSPPFGAVGDSSIIGSMVDGVILVVGAKKTKKGDLLNSLNQFVDFGANVIGVVTNGFNENKRGYYYSGYSNYSSYQAQLSEEKA